MAACLVPVTKEGMLHVVLVGRLGFQGASRYLLPVVSPAALLGLAGGGLPGNPWQQ